MNIDKVDKKNKIEIIGFVLIYVILFANAVIMQDSWIALVSAFCGITYTILAGKGFPICYFIGVIGSVFYSYLAFRSALWGNLILYLGYYIPMQITGFFQWNKHLKQNKSEIIKTNLGNKERIILILVFSVITFITVLCLFHFKDKSPVIDGITTVFSILAMYLTVKRCYEQWIVWFGVNLLSFIMWLKIALSGTKVYSTVIMWAVYTILAVYFYICWKKELKK